MLIIVIGGAMVAFILGELFSSKGQVNPNEQEVGVISGDPISLIEFDNRVRSDETFIKNGQPYIDDQQVRQQVWSQLVRERVLGSEAQDAGISLTKGEFDDLRWGENLLPELKNDPSILDSMTGQPNRDLLRQFFQNVETSNPTLYAYQKRQIRNGRVQTKYNNLVKSALFVNSLEAQNDFNARNAKADLRFIARPFANMADSVVAFEEGDLQRWYDANRNDEKYEQTASRSFDYVVFNVEPSAKDLQSLQDDLSSLKSEFESTEDDTLFAADNSNAQDYVVLPYQEGSLDLVTDSLILNADTGAVIGPYKEGNAYKLAKVKSMEMLPEVRYQQVQLSLGGSTPEETKERADSLKNVIKRKNNFADIVSEFSDDPAAKSNEGIIEWIDEQKVRDKKLAADLFGEADVNELRVVEGDMAVYIYRILEEREREQRNLVIIDRNIRPLEGTFKEMYKEANRFSAANNTSELFHSAALEASMNVEEVKDQALNQRFVRDLKEPDQLIRWVNKTEVGVVSEPFRSDERFVVAVVEAVKEKGVPAFEDLREIAEAEVIKEKKAEAMIAEMSGITDIDELATTLGETARSATGFTFSSTSFPGGFQEPELIGLAFSLEPGQTTVPLKGDNGVYVIKMESKAEAGEISDLSAEQKTILETRQGSSATSVYRALERKADVQDQRAEMGY